MRCQTTIPEWLLVATLLLGGACGDTTALRNPPIPDAESELGSEVTDEVAELQLEAEPDAAVEPDTDAIAEFEIEEMTPEPDAEPDAESEPAADAEVAREAEAEAEGEATEEPAPRCHPSHDPLLYLDILGDLDIRRGPPGNAAEGGLAADCQVDGYSFVAAAGMQVRAWLTPLGGASFHPRLTAWDSRAVSGSDVPVKLAEDTAAAGFVAELSFTAPFSGEYALGVSAADLHGRGGYAVEIECISGCGSQATRYPIVLLHGIAGWEGGILNVVEYFFDVEEGMRAEGFDVYTAVSSSFNDALIRSSQFAEQIDQILASTGAAKVHLIGHSQGGLDARYIISTLGYGDRVATVTFIATPHMGTVVADAVLGLLPDVAVDLIAPVINFIGELLGTGDEQDIKAAMSFLTREFVQNEFNPSNPDDPRVSYRSYTGRTCGKAEIICQIGNSGETVDLLLIATYRLIQLLEGPNDGLVAVEGAKYGDFRGELPADHWDEIGQIADLLNLAFDHRAFYRQLAADLAAEGY